MDDTRDGRAASIVDVSHSARNGSRGGDSAEEWRGEIGYALGDELGVGVMMVADDTVSHSG